MRKKQKHHQQVVPGNALAVKVIGQRYELNDKYVSVIAELITTNDSASIELAPAAASLAPAPLRLTAAASLVPANVPIAAASLANVPIAADSLANVPAAIMPALSVLNENTTMTLAPSSQIKKRTLKNVGPKKKLNIID